MKLAKQKRLNPGDEVLALRTRNSRTHWLGGDRFHFHGSLAPLHVPDDPAAWVAGRPVRWLRPCLRLRRVQGGLRLARAWYDLEIPNGWVGYRASSRVRAASVRLRLVALDGLPFRHVRPRAEGGRLWWRQIAPGLDISLRIDADCCEFYKHLYGPEAPRTFTWELAETGGCLQTDTRGHDNDGWGNPHREGTGVGRNRRQVRMEHERRGDLWVERWTGQTVALDASRVPYLSDEVCWPVLIDSVFSASIDVDGNDGDASGARGGTGNGTWHDFYKAGIHQIYYGTASTDHLPGYRFVSVTIPQGATVSSATLTVNYTKSAGASVGNGTLRGNATDNAPTLNTSGNTPFSMTVTTASIGFPSFGSGQGTGIKTANVATIVQEILNRAGWASGNALALAVRTPLSASGGTPYSYITDRNGGTSNVAVLDVNYTAGGGGVGNLLGEGTLVGAGCLLGEGVLVSKV